MKSRNGSVVRRTSALVGACVAAAWCGAQPTTLPAPVSPANGFPFVLPWDDSLAGTATDASGLNAKPAGVNGFIVARDGRFVESNTGRRVRFFGTNVAGRSAFPTKPDAEKIAARMAKLGINIVRFHHLNNGWDLDGGTVWKPGRTYLDMDPGQLDKLDYFVAQLKKHGIYSNINLQTARNYLPEMGFPESVAELRNFAKKVDKFNQRMIELQKEYAKNLLDRRNPYTGLKYSEDPAIMVVEINNENSLVGWPGESPGAGLSTLPEPFRSEIVRLWNDWLVRTYRSDANLDRAWPTERRVTGPSAIGPSAQWTHENQSDGDVEFRVLPGPRAAHSAPTIEATVRSNPGPDWHVQIHVAGLDLKNGESYIVEFRAKADRPVTIGVDSRLAKPDWRHLGLSSTVSVGTEWRDYSFSFRVIGSEPNSARIGFVLGAMRGTVTVADLRVFPGTSSIGRRPGESLAARNIAIPEPDLSPRSRDWTRFLVETETAYSEQMRDYLRRDLGFTRTNIVDTQISWGSLTSLVRERNMEFADNHAYWNHPVFLGGNWDPRNYRVDRRAMTNEMGGSNGEFRGLSVYRVVGKPYTVSEYNHPAPNDFQVEMMPLYAAFGAFQDWDILYTFAWDDSGSRTDNTFYNGYFDMALNPAKSAFFSSAARIFREFLVDPPAATAVLEVPAGRPWEPFFNPGLAWTSLGGLPDILRTRIGLRAADVRDPRIVRSGQPGPSPFQVSGDPGQRVLTVDAPKSKTVVGFVAERSFSLDGFRIEFGSFENRFAAATLVPTDGLPIASSKRMLLTVGARVENTDMGWNAARDSVSDRWGRGPVLAEFVPIRFSVSGDPVRVYALDERGARRGELAAVGGRFDNRGQRTMWFEIVRP
ncbi:MAG: hypothetical protein SNJ61_00005 [Fimbriimonadaceae bacterium]